MRPAFSVIFLTTLIGAGQGLFLAVYGVDVAMRLHRFDAAPPAAFFVTGSAIAAALCTLGLVASFFHLGRPERAWRAASCWRTSWLAREVIALPLFIVGDLAFGVAHWLGLGMVVSVGALACVACLALFVCTGMVYACIRFLQEWATPLTLVNFFLVGAASGTTLAAALATWRAPAIAGSLAIAATVLTLGALAGRTAALARNAALRPQSSLATAIGVRHHRIMQTAQGFMGGSFNTREFFHGASPRQMQTVKWGFLLLAFALPLLLLGAGQSRGGAGWYGAAFVIQYAGLLAERWYFLAQANHPQNLYYQAMS